MAKWRCAAVRRSRPVLMIAAVLLLTACSGETPSPSRTDRPIAPISASPTSRDAIAILTAYRKLQDLVTSAYAHPDRQPSPLLSRYAADKALSNIYAAVVSYRQQGIRVVGKPVIAPEVTSIDSNGQPKTAAITDCLDVRNWSSVDAKTGKSVSAPGQNRRYVVTARAKQIQGRWYIVSRSPDRSRKC